MALLAVRLGSTRQQTPLLHLLQTAFWLMVAGHRMGATRVQVLVLLALSARQLMAAVLAAMLRQVVATALAAAVAVLRRIRRVHQLVRVVLVATVAVQAVVAAVVVVIRLVQSARITAALVARVVTTPPT